MEDWVISKTRVKNLGDVNRAPVSVYNRQLWFNYFCTVVVNVIGTR
jgi:hypothetical protein